MECKKIWAKHPSVLIRNFEQSDRTTNHIDNLCVSYDAVAVPLPCHLTMQWNKYESWFWFTFAHAVRLMPTALKMFFKVHFRLFETEQFANDAGLPWDCLLSWFCSLLGRPNMATFSDYLFRDGVAVVLAVAFFILTITLKSSVVILNHWFNAQKSSGLSGFCTAHRQWERNATRDETFIRRMWHKCKMMRKHQEPS